MLCFGVTIHVNSLVKLCVPWELVGLWLRRQSQHDTFATSTVGISNVQFCHRSVRLYSLIKSRRYIWTHKSWMKHGRSFTNAKLCFCCNLISYSPHTCSSSTMMIGLWLIQSRYLNVLSLLKLWLVFPRASSKCNNLQGQNPYVTPLVSPPSLHSSPQYKQRAQTKEWLTTRGYFIGTSSGCSCSPPAWRHGG